MLPITGELGPTATYSRRSYCWLPAVGGMILFRRELPGGELVDETMPALGKLTLKMQHRQRRYLPVNKQPWSPFEVEPLTYKACKPSACELDSYAVDELDPEEPGTRLFAFLNLTDPEQREPYRVTVGGVNRCRCIAGIVDRYGCKHVSALEAILDELPERTSERIAA